MPSLTRITFVRPSAPLVISIIALISSLAGTAFAAGVLPAHSVGTKQLKARAVTAPKIKNKSVSAPKIGANAISSSKVANRSLLAVDFKAGELPAGSAGSAVAYGRSSGGAAPTLEAAAAKSFIKIVHSATGTYCLTPAAGISSASHPAFVSARPEGPTFAVGFALVDASPQPAGCAAGDYQVVTYRILSEAAGGPQTMDDVAFSIIVA